MIYYKSFSKLFYICLSLEKLFNEKYFPIKKSCGLVFISIPFILGENTFEKLIKLKNILLIIDYIKFDHQSFDCYIFCFYFILFFSICSLRI
jgi:hypothetical protein